jgi:hypothetical protein
MTQREVFCERRFSRKLAANVTLSRDPTEAPCRVTDVMIFTAIRNEDEIAGW